MADGGLSQSKRLAGTIIGGMDIVWGLLFAAAGAYLVTLICALAKEGLFPEREDMMAMLLCGLFMAVALIDVLTGALLIVGVAKGNKSFLDLWLCKARIFCCCLFPSGTIYYWCLISKVEAMRDQMEHVLDVEQH